MNCKSFALAALFLLTCSDLLAQAGSGVYVGGHIRRERPATVEKLKKSGFTYVILFNVNVEEDGTLTTDGETICKDGQYVFASEQPYYQEGQKKIYIPFFSRSLNQIYFDEPEKLLTSPYAGLKDKFQDTVVDPFDTYGSELYNSHFSRLVKVKQEDKETAFFHYDTNTIYFVNEQGRLDGTVVLFDRYLRRPSYSHMLERIRPVVDAYFNFDREGFINALYDNGFISSHLLHLIRFHDWARL